MLIPHCVFGLAFFLLFSAIFWATLIWIQIPTPQKAQICIRKACFDSFKLGKFGCTGMIYHWKRRKKYQNYLEHLNHILGILGSPSPGDLLTYIDHLTSWHK
jgi:hypothetical protein